MPARDDDGMAGLTGLANRPLLAALGCAILLGLAVDGARNRPPADDPDRMRASPAVEAAASPSRGADRDGTGRRSNACTEGGSEGGVATPPRPIGDQSRWITSDDYPAVALRDRLEGASAMALTVGTTCTVTNCLITSGSGHAVLDDAACTILGERARYEPARDAAGCPILSSVQQRIRWQIPID